MENKSIYDIDSHKNASSTEVAANAAARAEASAKELEQKANIARKAANLAHTFAGLARTMETQDRRDIARDYAKRALQESQTAAEAASLIL